MNTDDLNFAYKVRHALNEQADRLPSATSQRLAAARQLALSRKKADAPVPVAAMAPAGALARFSGLFTQQPAWLGRASLVIPAMMLIAGLTTIYQTEKEQRIAELAELDSAVLSDELPLSAYLDHGFNAYLSKHEQFNAYPTKREQ